MRLISRGRREGKRMKVASKIVFLFKDSSEDFGTAIFYALHLNPSSSLRRVEESFELSLEFYGIKDRKACGDLVHFVDDKGVYEVSVLLLRNYEPPVLACAVNEVLAQITGEMSVVPTFVVPFLMESSKFKLGSKPLMKTSLNASIYGLQIGPGTDVTQAMVTRTEKLPSSLQIQYESLACFLHLVRILNLPTILLLGISGGHHNEKSSGEELEILYEIGELLASISSLCFLRDKITWTPSKTTRNDKEPWRALYG